MSSNDVCKQLEEAEWGMLAHALEAGNYVFFIASGLSKEAGLPTGNELAEKMIEKLYRRWADPINMFRNSFNYHGSLELPKVTQLIENQYGREKLIEFLSNCINWEEVDAAYVHDCIGVLAMKIRERGKAIRIITPNYDMLIEDSLHLTKDVIVLDEQYTAARDAWPWVLKIHGCIKTQPTQTIRITESDLSRSLESWKKGAIRDCLSPRRGLVVIGYGATDIHVKRIINRGIREANRKSYWVSPGKPPHEIMQSLARKGGRYIQMYATSFFKNTGIL